MNRTIPFFRPSITDAEIDEVVACLRSGWLTTGPRAKQFEADFAASIGGKFAVAVNSCTAALHLAVEALQLRPGQAVLVPTMTFAATAEIVRYQGAVPLLVDCDPVTLNMNLEDADRKLSDLRAGRTPLDRELDVVGIIPVHVGGLMMDMEQVQAFASSHRLWVIEDAAHAYPAAYRKSDGDRWRHCGQNTSSVACFSFYANKTITTGEGGMAVTDDAELADRMRLMSLHGLSHDAWKRYAGNTAWDYRIVAPGYKYNLTDVAAAIGIHQVARAEEMRLQREALVARFRELLRDVEAVELLVEVPNRIHAWHLFPIRLRLDLLSVDRNTFMSKLREAGIGCSVHWRPLHLHTYYQEVFQWQPEHLPVATREWERLISLPLFPGMSDDDVQYLTDTVQQLSQRYKR